MLWERMKEEGPESQPFGYSPESLIPLWDWYETKMKYDRKRKLVPEFPIKELFGKYLPEEFKYGL